MWKKRVLIYALQFVAITAYADGANPYPNGDNNIVVTDNYANNSAMTVTTTDTSSRVAKQPQNTDQSMQNLANFLAQNPGVAAQVAQILNGQDNTAANTAAQTDNSTANTQTAATTTVTTTTQLPWDANDQTTADARNNAFNSIANEAFPLTPDQIKTLNNMLDATQRAQAAAPNDAPPEPTSSSLMVALSPGSTPPVIRLSRGFVSSLVFVDSTGASWPIESYDIGNPSAFDITWDKKSNTLMIQARSTYTYGNLAVKLKDLNTPVMLTLVPGQKVVDYRVDLRIEGLGPNAQPGMQGSGLPGQADPVLLNVLDGVPPDGAKRLSVSSNVVQVWTVGDKTMYVRTAFTLLSPAWLSKMSSADGMNAYQLQVTPMLLLSRYGKVLQIKVEGL